MNYQNRPCFISNVNHKTPNGKLGIKLNFYDSMDDAKDTMYENYVNFDFNSFKTLLNIENLNLSSITIDNISTNDEVKSNIYKYKLTGLFKEFYKLDEKLFSGCLRKLYSLNMLPYLSSLERCSRPEMSLICDVSSLFRK